MLSSPVYALFYWASVMSSIANQGKSRGRLSLRSLSLSPLNLPITRATIHPLLDRLGIDTLAGRMARLREDERFKAVGPDSIVLPYPTPANTQIGLKPESENEGEIWFDWAFVDFWKANYREHHLRPVAFS